jgi:hypothetical protein
VLNTNTGDKNLDGNTRELLNMIRGLQAIDVLKGRLVEGVDLANATDVDVAHLLGRAWKGWIVVDTYGASSAGRIDGTAPTVDYDRAQYLRLRATGYGATITVSLWVF